MTAGRSQAAAPVDDTVDAREVRFYAELADRWWDTAGPFWPLHRLNALRVQYLHRSLSTIFATDQGASRPFDGLRMVDIGCGGGILSEAMATRGAAVTAIDVVANNIQAARHHSQEQGLDIDYRLAAASELRALGETFDVVLNMEVVEHVADLRAFMQDCCALVRPGGVMVIATINRTWLSYLFAILGAEYVLRWLPKGTHQWRRFPRPDELALLLADQGLKVVDKVGVAVNPLTRKFSVTSSDRVNYMLMAQKPPAA